jgi:hypothetical protein
VKIYLLLVLALIPRRVSAAIVALMPGALQRKLLPEMMGYLFSPYPRSKAKRIGAALRDSAAALDIIADAPSSTQLNR